MRRLYLVAMSLLLFPDAVVRGQVMDAVVDSARVTVGDPVTVTVRGSTARGSRLAERVLRAMSPLPDGVRILRAETASVSPGGAIEARVRVAFFRPGSQQVPPLVLTLRPPDSATGRGYSLVTRPIPVEVLSLLPPGNYSLSDIKDIETSSIRWWMLGVAAALLAAIALAALRLRRRAPRRAPLAADASPPPQPTPYEQALNALREIEAARLPARGEVARHYALLADVLRRYLEDAHEVPALERTTAEIRWALPPALSSAAHGFGDALDEADLVKFARLRPDGRAAAEYVGRVGAVLADLHAAGESAALEAHALR